MAVYCPHCMRDILPTDGGTCPSCGQSLLGEDGLMGTPRDRLIHFHTTLLHMTPRTWMIPAIVVVNIVVFVAMLVAGSGFFGPKMDNMIEWGELTVR